MTTYFLQRERPFGKPGKGGIPSKKALRHALELASKRHPFTGEFPRFIDTTLHKGAELIDTAQADNWLAAKKHFGYPLTNKQAEKLLSIQTEKVLRARKAA